MIDCLTLASRAYEINVAMLLGAWEIGELVNGVNTIKWESLSWLLVRRFF